MVPRETPRPSLARGEVSVSVRAWSPGRAPAFAGTVASVGAGVKDLAPGDAVHGTAPLRIARGHAFLAAVAVAAREARPVPRGLSLEQAVVLGGPGLCALDGLRNCGDMHGRRVLVTGARGGVGHLAVQIARARGAEVVEHLGGTLPRRRHWYDVVLDGEGSLDRDDAAYLLARGGWLVTTGPVPPWILRAVWGLAHRGIHVVTARPRGRAGDHAVLERLVEAGRVVPRVGPVLPPERADQAWEAERRSEVPGGAVVRLGGPMPVVPPPMPPASAGDGPSVVHFELQARDVDRAMRFYREVFHWEFHADEGTGRWVLEAGAGGLARAGENLALERVAPFAEGRPPSRFPCTLGVRDLARMTARAERSGGRVEVPRTRIPGVGWLAYLRDTEGNVLALVEADVASGEPAFRSTSSGAPAGPSPSG
jgi:predicted enzyme related to lactoylglutathione lyase/NADPH:quinone reductase-like Zn-dependent oxidoreductase